MISKHRDKPGIMEKMEILLERMPPNHSSARQIEAELAKYRAGFYGEKEVDFHLRELDRPGIFILHDLRLRTSTGSFFQIDTLILTESAAIILEVKNYAGPLKYDSNARQLIRQNEVMPNPFLQVRRQQNHLQHFCQHDPLPTRAFVVFVNPQTRLTIEPPDDKISHLLLYPSEIASKLHSSTKRMTGSDLSRLATRFKKAHQPFEQNILNVFKLNDSIIRKGVRCPHCAKMGMERRYGTWYCHGCDRSDRHAHIRALYDYCMIKGDRLTLLEAMDFLQVPSRHAARRLLLPVSSREKRIYALDTGFLRGRCRANRC